MSASGHEGSGKLAVFGPDPLLSVSVESRPTGGDEIHVHAAGQGVWVTRMAGELGADPVLCGFLGGETGSVLRPLLEQLRGELRLVETAAPSGCYVSDRRSGERELISMAAGPPPSRHEVDDLFSTTCAAALEAGVLVVCNPYPAETLPLGIYGSLVADVRENGATVLVDLSSPRLDSALEGSPDLVKLNDWELAEFVSGPVDGDDRLRSAAEELRRRGAGTVVVSRAERPALVVRGDGAWWLTPPRFDRGAREGCGDSMTGAIAACLAQGRDWREALVLGAAAGAANFLRHGLGTGARGVIGDLARRVELTPAG
ncbi:MAG: PfkB family carbohydrate kinase [Solirubrobacterales bacterium]